MNVASEAGMNVIKVNKRIESSDIHIDGLDKYIGKDAEIIVLIDQDKDHDWPDNFFDETYGFMRSEKLSRGDQGNFSTRETFK